MSSRVDVPSVFRQLAERRERLRVNLTRLASGTYVPVTFQSRFADDDVPQVILSSAARVRQTDFRFRVWEDFRNIDEHPYLHAFTYSLEAPDPELGPVFRYECHPDVEDVHPDEDDDGPEVNEDTSNPYSVIPHFHPNKALTHPISKLHYPFLRSERSAVVFAIIAWIERDLVKRFYDSGRVTAA